MDAQRRWDLMRTYEDILALPDPPHGFLARFAGEAAAWIAALEAEDRAFAASAWESLWDETLEWGGRTLRLRYRKREVLVSGPVSPEGQRAAVLTLPPDLAETGLALHSLHGERGTPAVLLRRRAGPDLVLRLDLQAGRMEVWDP